ncbi:MAG TPA: M20/M25/M40 family metallo-hydrolase [Kiritimatiellia bacterium]|nr:M20/M25/M40 family metallo-hydrolase [Kiritimatiellia bacterium]
MKKKKAAQPWNQPLPEAAFEGLREVLAAPSPIGLEAAMTYGVIKPRFESFMPRTWKIHQFKGNAGIVLDTHPGRDDMFSVMLVGHADKIRLQVRSIGDDGKIWINSDSFLPLTLIGHEVILFSEHPKKPGIYRRIEGGTIEALGAIHFVSSDLRTGAKGIKPEQLYLELQIHGSKAREQVEDAGIKPGDTLILNRPIRRGFSPDTFYGAYLDNGLGSYVTLEAARLLAAHPPQHTRVMFGIATHEEIGRFGSRVLAASLRPDVLIGIDVDHDYKQAPGVGDQRYAPVTLGGGFSITPGAVTSETLNAMIVKAARARDIPYQLSPSGRDTGTDAMASSLAGIDSASASLGIPIRNMHTISEVGHTRDLLACIHVIKGLVEDMEAANGGRGMHRDDLRNGHPRLDKCAPLSGK